GGRGWGTGFGPGRSGPVDPPRLSRAGGESAGKQVPRAIRTPDGRGRPRELEQRDLVGAGPERGEVVSATSGEQRLGFVQAPRPLARPREAGERLHHELPAAEAARPAVRVGNRTSER